MMLKILLLLGLLLSGTLCLNFTSKVNKTVADATLTSIRFSRDQMFLAGLDKDNMKVVIYDGFTLDPIQPISLNATNISVVPTAVSFSNKNNYLAIGGDDGDILLFQKDSSGFKTEPFNRFQVEGNHGVNTLEFTIDESVIIVGAFDGNITFYDVTPPSEDTSLLKLTKDHRNLKIGPIAFGTQLNSLAVGPQTGNLIVGGGDQVGGPLLKLYDASNNYQVLKEFVPPLSQVQSVAFSEDQSLILSTGINGSDVIVVYSGIDYDAKENLNATTAQNLYEVLISTNGLYIAAAGNTNAYAWNKVADQWVPQAQIASSLEDIALSPFSGDLVVFNSNLLAEYSLCAFKTYYDQGTDTCPDCLTNCASCYNSPDTCFACEPKFYLNVNTCAACMPGCNACSDAATCSDCDAALNWQLIDNVCVCTSRFFQEDDVCKPCITGCLTCGDAATCETCDTQGNFEKVDNLCQCIAKFRLEDITCVACGLGCLQCDANQCTSCDNEKHFVPQAGQQDCICDAAGHFVIDANNVCVCEKGFYDDNNGTCSNCRVGCLDCTSDTNCTECADPTMTKPDGICLCPEGQYFNSTSNCTACTVTLPYCTKCDSDSVCTACDATLNRVLENNVCVCDKGFFQNAQNRCQPCGIPGCVKCQSTTNCTLCDQTQHWIDDQQGDCLCESRYLKVNDQCVRCTSLGCMTCKPDIDTCIECDTADHWHEVDPATCECDAGYYPGGEIICQQCQFGCKQCLNATECTQCYTEGHYVQVDADCKCEKGYYPFNITDCNECTLKGCEDCSSATQCTTCFPTYKKTADNKCVCEDKKFPDGNKCSNCESPCLTCESRTKCKTCVDGYSKNDNNECIEDGLSPLIIVLIVVAGLAVIGAGFAIIKYCKKKRSPLEEEGAYEPVE